jgi:ribonucleoside-diphosphate reductase alpha chain
MPNWTKNALKVSHERLLMPHESPEEMTWRVSSFLFGDSPKAEALTQRMLDRDFFPNSPALRNLGDPEMPGLPHACFVLHIPDDLRGIFTTLLQAALIHQAGGGDGACFSNMRPAGSMVRSTKGVSSGPVSFLADLFDPGANVVKQGGQRRGAKMATFSVYHPDIEAFITLKSDLTKATNFNVSVLVDDLFFKAVDQDLDLCLTFPTRPGVFNRQWDGSCLADNCQDKHISARYIFDLIALHAHEHGEPGLLFVDQANERNPHPELYTLEATNPCGEQWLGPYESCVLGSINVANYEREGSIDWDRLARDIPLYVEALDRMIDRAKYPIPEIEAATKRTRRIGLGVMGVADLLFKLGLKYDTEAARDFCRELGTFIRTEAHNASIALAVMYGPYPACNGTVGYRRNAAVTTVAPTGTLSILADCSSGIEPAFALAYVRQHRLDKVDANALTVMEDANPVFRAWRSQHQYSPVPDYFVTAHEISPADHVRMQAVWQESFSDNAISKTVNIPHDGTVQDIKEAMRLAYSLGCLGFTCYRDGSRAGQVLTPMADCSGPACAIVQEEEDQRPSRNPADSKEAA